MVNKDKLLFLALKLQPLIVDALCLKHWKITVSVKNSSTSAMGPDNAATTYFMTRRTADICLHHNKILDHRDAVLTILHEFLHIRFNHLNLRHAADEKLVQRMEALFALFV